MVTFSPMMVSVQLLISVVYFFPKHKKHGHMFLCLIAIKNPRENTRSSRTSHELKRTYDMMEGPMNRGHPARDGAPYEGTACVLVTILNESWCVYSLSVCDGAQFFFRVN